MRDLAKPITADERRGRIEKARRLMAEHKIDALLLTGGTSLVYFSGIRWGFSERLFAMVVPRKGEPFIVSPAFEEDRAREQIASGPFGGTADVRTWEEDESPYERVAQGLRTAASPRGRLGIEETCATSSATASPRRRRAEARERHPGDRRLPHDQGRARARADAPGVGR